MGGTVGEIEFAKRRARNLFDEWNDVTGVIGKFSGYYYEVMACIDDAVDCGFQTALDDYKSLSDGEESTPPKSEEVEQSKSHNTDILKIASVVRELCFNADGVEDGERDDFIRKMNAVISRHQ
jgi:hypothetical protein